MAGPYKSLINWNYYRDSLKLGKSYRGTAFRAAHYAGQLASESRASHAKPAGSFSAPRTWAR